MRFILPEPDSIPGWSREKCWFLAPFLSISAPTVFSLFTNKPAASLLTLFRSERNEGMNWKACVWKSADLSFWDAFGAASSTQAVFIKMHETSLCLRQHSGTLTRARGWVRKHAGIMPDFKGEIWFHGLPLKREIKAGMEETGGIRKEHGFKYSIQVSFGTYRV